MIFDHLPEATFAAEIPMKECQVGRLSDQRTGLDQVCFLDPTLARTLDQGVWWSLSNKKFLRAHLEFSAWRS